jgi:hypothetical protein
LATISTCTSRCNLTIKLLEFLQIVKDDRRALGDYFNLYKSLQTTIKLLEFLKIVKDDRRVLGDYFNLYKSLQTNHKITGATTEL